LAPWVSGLVEECAAFPQGAHDDQVDALTQALNRLVLQPLLSGELIDMEDLDPELADFSISPY
jgi:phage terminase large subunit-like protein